MAKRNQNIDNFFKEKLSGFQVPDKKGNWQVLNNLLDARERRKRMARRALFFSSFLAIVFFGVFVFNPFGNKIKNTNTNVTQGSSANAPAVAPVAGTSNSENASGNENRNAEINTNPDNSHAQPEQNKTEAEKNVKEVKDNPKQTADENNISKNASKNSNIKIAVKKKTTNGEVATGKNKKQSSALQIAMNIAGAEKSSKTPSEEPKISGQTKIPDDAAQGNAKTESENPPVTNVPVAPAPAVDSSKVTVAQAEKTSPKDSLDNLDKNATKKDSDLTASHPRFFGFNVFAGVNVYRTQSNSLTDSRNISPMVGMEILHGFSQHISVGLGVAYCLQDGYHLSDTATKVSYFLEKNVAQQIILIRKQHRLYVPLTVYYMISEKHAVSAGVQWSYLMNTVGDYTESNTTEDGINMSRKTDVKGYMDGINSSAFSFSVGYRYSISKQFDIQMRFIQEFADEYTPQYFYDVNTAPSWSLQTLVFIKF